MPRSMECQLADLARHIEEQLETLHGQYDAQLDSLRRQTDGSGAGPRDGEGETGGHVQRHEQHDKQARATVAALPRDQQETVGRLLRDMEHAYEQRLTHVHQQHVVDVDAHAKEMRSTLGQIYESQSELLRSELDESTKAALQELREALDTEHREEVTRLEQDWAVRLQQLTLDYDRQLREAQLEGALSKGEKSDFISELNQRLTEEHKQILHQIEDDLERESITRDHLPSKQHTSRDSQTDSEIEEPEIVPSTAEKRDVLAEAANARLALESQHGDVAALRTRMLQEYEQHLGVRAEVMASQTQDVEGLQAEMGQIQAQYEDMMATFQASIESHTEEAIKTQLSEQHARELEEIKQYYEVKVVDMENSYSEDLSQLKLEHVEQLAAVSRDPHSSLIPGTPPPSTLEKERDYVRKTTTLTAISDSEETPPPSPISTDALEGRVKILEHKLRDKEILLDELKKRLDAETTSAEDLHGKLLDSSKTLQDLEENLKAKIDEIDALQRILLDKDGTISNLEMEKAALEEKGEKDKYEHEGGTDKLILELRNKISKLEEYVSASKAAEHRIQKEMNQLSSQHQDAIMALKTEMENVNKVKIEYMESEFKQELEVELEKQAKDLANKHLEELTQQSKEIENANKTEAELKEQISVYEQQHEELREQYECQLEDLQRAKVVSEKGDEVHLSSLSLSKYVADEDRDNLEASIRENVRAEILLEYELSVDELKTEYENRISNLNTKIQSYETQGIESLPVIVPTHDISKEQLDIRETMKTEVAKEFKEKLQFVTQDYESRLKQLQDIVDAKSVSEPSVLPTSKELERRGSETIVDENGKIPNEYQGYVATIRLEYEEKINFLQDEIAQYKSKISAGPPSPKMKDGDTIDVEIVKDSRPDAGGEIKPVKQVTPDSLRQDIYEEINSKFEDTLKTVKSDYQNQLQELTDKLSALQEQRLYQSVIENKIRESVAKEYDEKVTNLEKDFDAKIAPLAANLEKAINDKTTAEQKVKADMFVWHEEIITQLRHKHEATISELRREYEEKMELYREELQEGFDLEKERMLQEHNIEIADLEDRYEELVEGIRSGDAPEVAALVQEKFDMELEMARTLIQQECEETLESEQIRLSEQHDEQIQCLLQEREQDLDTQKAAYEKELDELRITLLQQNETQLADLEQQHRLAAKKAMIEFEAQLREAAELSTEVVESPRSVSLDQVKMASKESELIEKDGEEETDTEVSVITPRSDSGDSGDEDRSPGGGAAATTTGDKERESADKQDGDSGQQDQHTDGHWDRKDSKQPEMDVAKLEAPLVEISEASSIEGVGASETQIKDMAIDFLTISDEIVVQSASDSFKSKSDTLRSELDTETIESELVKQLRQELADKEKEYKLAVQELEAVHAVEVVRLTRELQDKTGEYESKIKQLVEQHEQELKFYEDTVQELKEDLQKEPHDAIADVDTSALDAAHEQELADLEGSLSEKHRNDVENLERRYDSRLDDAREKHRLEVEQLQTELAAAHRALEQYPDIQEPGSAEFHIVPTFHSDTTLESTKGSVEGLIVPSQASVEDASEQRDTTATSLTGNMETQMFTARSSSEEGSQRGTLDGDELQSLETDRERRGSLRGIDDTQTSDLLQFSEDDGDKSLDEGADSGGSDRGSPAPLIPILAYGAVIPGGPTIVSLDDTTDSSVRMSEREEATARVRELEYEVEELQRRLERELRNHDDQLERLDGEKQEASNLEAMLRSDIERLHHDREVYQNTNEHLLGLLSDTVKTYMGVEDTISRRLRELMQRPPSSAMGERSTDSGRPGSAERRRTPPPRRSPVLVSPSPGRLSPARADDGEQNTSVVSNVTDEGLDLSQRISDSIFPGPDLAADEEDLLTDSGSRLQASVSRLLEMVEETTSQLLDVKHTQSDLLDNLQTKTHKLEQHTIRVSELDERLRDEVGRKDFLAMELHKAEGLIEGYSTERDVQDQKLHDLEEQKEALILDLETTKNKMLELMSVHSENEDLRNEGREQRALIEANVGEEAQATGAIDAELVAPSGKPALMLEVTRLNSANRDKEQQIRVVHERYESRVRDLETSGEDMEHHYTRLLDDKKQEVADLSLQVEALDKQLKAKKQFIEEQSGEREQEHEDYQTELARWKERIHDLEKQNGTGSRLQREIDDLSEQLQARIELHNAALVGGEKAQRDLRDRDLSVQEFKSIIQQLEQELQDRIHECQQHSQKIAQLEDELSKRPYTDDELTDSARSELSEKRAGEAVDFMSMLASQQQGSLMTQLSVEEELRMAQNRTKEELIREKHELQLQCGELLKQISALRNQLDEMRQRTDFTDPAQTSRRLELERQRSEEKGIEIEKLKLTIEQITEDLDNREQQISQLGEQREAAARQDRGAGTQLQALKAENKQLRERVQLSAETSSVTDISGLSQNLLEEKNQEIDHLSQHVFRLQTEFAELRADKGVDHLYDEIESYKDELKQRESDISELQSVRVSTAFTDHSLTPDSSMIPVRESFSEKTSIQQEMEESVAIRLDKVASLEAELSSMKGALHERDVEVDKVASLEAELSSLKVALRERDMEVDKVASLEAELSSLKVALQERDVEVDALKTLVEKETLTAETPVSEGTISSSTTEDVGMLQDMIHEKEELITQLTVQIDGLQAEVDNLSDFQNKLQEDFDIVQTMLEEKDREIETLTKELTDKPATHPDEHSVVIKHEVEITRLRKALREKDNVIEEKMEELAEISDKLELLDADVVKYRQQEQTRDLLAREKDIEIHRLQKQVDDALKIPPPPPPMAKDEKDELIHMKSEEIDSLNDKINIMKVEVEKLKQQLLERPPSPLRQDEKFTLIKNQQAEITEQKDEIRNQRERIREQKGENLELKEEIEHLKNNVESLLGQPPSDDDESQIVQKAHIAKEKAEIAKEQKQEVESYKKEIKQLQRQVEQTEYTSELVQQQKEEIKMHKEEIESLKQQVEAVELGRPPSPPSQQDEKSLVIKAQKLEIETMKRQVDAALQIRPPSPPISDIERSELIHQQETEIAKLKKQLDAALKIAPPLPPMTEDEKDEIIEKKEKEVKRLRHELTQISKSVIAGKEEKLIAEKVQEVLQLEENVSSLKDQLNSQSTTSVGTTTEESDHTIKQQEKQIQHLKEELDSMKGIKSYEDQILLKDREAEIEQLQGELESYRSRDTSFSLDMDLSMSESGAQDSKQLARSMSFYKDQYEEKCSESRQLQVSLDLIKQQLEKSRSEKAEDIDAEIEIAKGDLERKMKQEMREKTQELSDMEQELHLVQERIELEKDDHVAQLEKELQTAKDLVSNERKDNVQTLKDMELLRDKKEKERKDSSKTIQELESTLEKKTTIEKRLNKQIDRLAEELTDIKRHYAVVDKAGSPGTQSPQSRSPKHVLSQLRSASLDSVELGTDIATLQQQVQQYKQQADKVKEVMAEKNKYQSQVIKLEIEYETLQKKMKKEVGHLEDQARKLESQPSKEVWDQLHATQDRLETTTRQLTNTSERLGDMESKLSDVNRELMKREDNIKEVQEDLWKTAGQLSITTGKLQETELKLRQTVSQVTEREEQIHRLQGELQQSEHETQQVTMEARQGSPPGGVPDESEKLKRELRNTKAELEEIKTSLKESVEMSEQQLILVEQKDQEFVNLKLDIQQAMADKEKIIREQKHKLKVATEREQDRARKEKEVGQQKLETQQTLAAKDREIGRLKEDAAHVKEELHQGRVVAVGDTSMSNFVSLKAQLRDSEDSVQQLKSKLDDSQSSVEQLSSELQQNKSSVQLLTSELQQSQSSVHHLTSDLEQSQSSLQHLTLEPEQSQSSLQHLTSELEQSRSHVQHLVSELEQSQSSVQRLTSELQQSQSSIQDLPPEQEESQLSVEQLTSELQQSQSSFQYLQTDLEQSQSLVGHLTSELQQSQSSMQHLETELGQSQSLVQQFESQLSDVRSTVSDRETKIGELQNIYDQRRLEEECTMQAMHQQMSQLQEEVNHLQASSKPDSLQGRRIRSPDGESERQEIVETQTQQHVSQSEMTPEEYYESHERRKEEQVEGQMPAEREETEHRRQQEQPRSRRSPDSRDDSKVRRHDRQPRGRKSSESSDDTEVRRHDREPRGRMSPERLEDDGNMRQQREPDSYEGRRHDRQATHRKSSGSSDDTEVRRRRQPRGRRSPDDHAEVKVVQVHHPDGRWSPQDESEDLRAYDQYSSHQQLDERYITPHTGDRDGSFHRGQPPQGQRSQDNVQDQSCYSDAEKQIQQLRRELLIARTAIMQIQRGSGFDLDGTRGDLEHEQAVGMDRAQGEAGVYEPRAAEAPAVHGQVYPGRAEVRYERLPDMEDVPRLHAELQRAREELALYRNSSNMSARDFVQKVMDLKDELSMEHERHIDNMTSRAHQDTELQLTQMRLKFEDEIEHTKRLHGKEIEQKLRELQQTMERSHKGDTNKLVVKYQEQIGVLKTRAGDAGDVDVLGMDVVGRLQEEVATTDQFERDRSAASRREAGVGQDREPTLGMSDKLQALLRRLHNEGVQVLSITELQYLNHSLGQQDLPHDADVDTLKTGWENERQSYLSTIQSLKDLLAQTHRLRGLDKDDDDSDDDDDLYQWYGSIEGSDWRAELLRAIGYVFAKERETLLAELRSHVLSHPAASVDETQRLEQKIRNMEAHHESAMEQIVRADRQSLLAEVRDLRAHSTIARLQHQEDTVKLSERLNTSEDKGSKTERHLKRQDDDDEPDSFKVQLLEFKIQQEKVLQEDLRTSLEAERSHSNSLSGQLNHEKTSNLDLQSNFSQLQVHVAKLKDSLEREQSRFVSVTSALEEEKSKCLSLQELLESERNSLWRAQSELSSVRETIESQLDPRAIKQLEAELVNERDQRCQAESQHEIDKVTIDNLRQEIDMEKRHNHAIETESQAKTSQLQKHVDMEKHKVAELDNALEREHALTLRLRQTLDEAQSHQEASEEEKARFEDLQMELENERRTVHDLNNVLHREQRGIEELQQAAELEKSLLKDHLGQERAVNHELKHELDSLQLDKLEAVRLYEKEKELVKRIQMERDQFNDEIRKLKALEHQRDRDREAERGSDKKSVRDADRQKEEYRMKLHEQELESQRLTQKLLELQEDVAKLRENELLAIRELEHGKLHILDLETQIQALQTKERVPSPVARVVEVSRDERRERLLVYRSQLESMCQSLHYLVLRCREQLSQATHTSRQADMAEFDAMQSSLRELLSEVKQIQELEGNFMTHPAGSVNERILRHNEELTNFVARISEEKTELRNTLTNLEEEVWSYRQKEAKYQEMQRQSEATGNTLVAEHAKWAKERLSLQMVLNSAEREIDQLQTDLRIERERRVAAGITDTRETDKVKIQRLYGKYLRAESFRKALVYQKKYLLLLLGGFQDTEETTLSLLARMGAAPTYQPRRPPPALITTFRGAVRAVIAIHRMKYLVKKWRRATRVGVDVVSGSLDQANGYVAHTGSYSPPRRNASPRFTPATVRSTSPPVRPSYRPASPLRFSDPAPYTTQPARGLSPYSSPRVGVDVDTYLSSSYTSQHAPHMTPPTKDYSSTTRYTSPSSSARRKILTSTTVQAPSIRPSHVSFMSSDSTNGAVDVHDDYINRLESLQTRLGTLQTGPKRTWKHPWR